MRSFLVLLFLFTALNAKESVEVFSKHITATADYFTATQDVVLLYDGALVKAKKATYDKKRSLLTLSGGVEMIREDETKISSEELVIDTSTKSIKFSKILLTTQEDLWIDAQEAKKEDNNYIIYNSKLSSCNKHNPDWTIEFAEANYRKNKNFISLKDAKLSFFNQPIFYFPYLAFPTVDERTTGLLLPQFRFSKKEGFIYQQPIFYVLANNLDMEFNPQLRTSRGVGGHITTRFVDSNYSEGSFTLGYFKNENSFALENNVNKEHYGFEFLYKSTDILPKSTFFNKYESGLYVNATYLNDLEYLNLQKNRASSLLSSNLIESRLNAFVYDEKDYLGLYAKYYIDISKTDNSNTIQELPSLQYHSFINYLISDKLFYTFDARLHNYTRVKGSRAYQTEFDLPITYYDSFFNDYVDFSFSENLYLSDVFFSNLNKKSKNYRYYRNIHKLELSSDLVKQYGENTHTLHPSLTYTKPSFENERPVKYLDLNKERQELFVTQTQKENLNIGLSQYFYNKNIDMTLSHRFAFVEFPKENLSKGDINNELSYSKDSLNLYSNLFYSLDKNKLHSLTSSLTYNQSKYDIILTHFYNNDFLSKNKKTNFVNAQFVHKYNKYNRWFVQGDYDVSQKFNHQWNLGWSHRQKCWGAKLSIGQERIPNFVSSFRNSMVYFEVNLNPLGGIAQNIEQEFSSQGK